ncbi:YaaA family protein [Dactylosporangium sp. NPDC051541]|uniref:YaaA family protein n=1 Tax=Dactylosporangium sp. NPDC051541 TaxID=3363977 RepID=UPI0037B3E240
MFILLPPSEGKADAPRRGAAVDLAKLSVPELAEARRAVMDDLVKLAADPPAAIAVLGLGAGQTAEVERNARLETAPAQAAGKVYTGVLYDALDLAGLDAKARARAGRELLIFSGLWGVVGLKDRIPPYRCSIGVNLAGVGTLAAHWKRALKGPLDALVGDALVLDLRSSAYAGMWAPRNAVGIRVLHGGKVVSHFNKATKGRIVRALLTSGARPRTAGKLTETLRGFGYRVEEPRSGQVDIHVEQL